MYVIGDGKTTSCEVIDFTCNKFVLLNSTPVSLDRFFYLSEAIYIRSNIFIFHDTGKVMSYDVENDKWSIELCKAIKRISFYPCVKVLQFIVMQTAQKWKL